MTDDVRMSMVVIIENVLSYTMTMVTKTRCKYMIEGALILNARVGIKRPGNRVSHHQDGTVTAVIRVITNDEDVGIDVIHNVASQCHHVERRKGEEISLGILVVTVSNQTNLTAQRA